MKFTDRYDLYCRNDGVILKITDRGTSDSGLVIPQISVESKKFTVVAMGPQVTDLELGDECLPRGTVGAEYFPLPFANDLIFLDEKNVVVVMKKKVLS